MNLKLTGLREVVGGPSDPGGFVHNFIFEKIRLMRKKSLLRLKNGRIFYISPSLKMVKKCIWVTYQRRKCFLCVLWRCFFVLWTLWILYYIRKIYLGSKHCFSKIFEAFKTQKSNNVRIFYISPSLKMLKNALGFHFRGTDVFNVSYKFAFLFYRLSGYRTTFQKLIWGVNTTSKTFSCL